MAAADMTMNVKMLHEPIVGRDLARSIRFVEKFGSAEDKKELAAWLVVSLKLSATSVVICDPSEPA